MPLRNNVTNYLHGINYEQLAFLMISCTASMKNIAKISSYYVLPIKLYFIVFLISPLEVKLSIYDALTLLIRYIYLCTHHSKANLGAEPDANLDPSLRRGNLSIKHSTWDQARYHA